MPLLLEDKVILVTGGSTGIGRASSLRCAEEGAALTIADINVEAGRAVAEEINANGGRALFVETDVADRPRGRSLAGRAVVERGVDVRAEMTVDPKLLFPPTLAVRQIVSGATEQCAHHVRPFARRLDGFDLGNEHGGSRARGLRQAFEVGCVESTRQIDELHGVLSSAVRLSLDGQVIFFLKRG